MPLRTRHFAEFKADSAKYVTFLVNAVYYKYRARISTLPGESTLNKAIVVPMRIKCLLAITGVLIFLLLIAVAANAYIEAVS
jgi:hypothetical protein